VKRHATPLGTRYLDDVLGQVGPGELFFVTPRLRDINISRTAAAHVWIWNGYIYAVQPNGRGGWEKKSRSNFRGEFYDFSLPGWTRFDSTEAALKFMHVEVDPMLTAVRNEIARSAK
jgi:hypothetical protein